MISRPTLHAASAAARWAACAAAVLASACSAPQTAPSDRFLGFITPYRIEIVQGNVVTREQAARLRPGMTREQVRDILGSPMLADPFHANRWDYVFTIRRQGTEPQRRSIVAHFNGDALERLEVPDTLPTENEFVASIAPSRGTGQPPVLELSPEQRKALPLPPKPEVAAVQAPLGPARPYPPLESP